ncbi:MAG: polynucleotide adenylyltransferase PcnB [Gammaproteobacteria bacterium]|nr:polynucleotide adenylyltransferase PcnB [Gammaproteobacteria bacterium]
MKFSIFKRTKEAPPSQKSQVYSAAEWRLKPSDFHPHALQIIKTLQDGGYQAFIVGGGVRDQLVSLHPKDFDIATNATPEQVKGLFNHCLIIGRRFRLAHVYFKRHIFEVATFRRDHTHAVDVNQASHRDGIITRDNVYGSVEEDALRRDFTVNALYYNPADNSICDYTDGIGDFKAKQIRVIGNPVARFKEDPVRILRAIRIATKLSFTLEPETERAIAETLPFLDQMPGARLFDEYTKLFLHGHAIGNFAVLNKHHIFITLFPATIAYVDDANFTKLAGIALRNTDYRYIEQKGVNPAFLISVFLWRAVTLRQQEFMQAGELKLEAFNHAATEILSSQLKRMAMPKRFSANIREIWSLQHVLENRRPKLVEKVLTHPRFRAAYDFLYLRGEIGEVPMALVQWWEKLQTLDHEAKISVIRSLQKPKKSKANAG